MKGLFIPDITLEMFRNSSLESIETLMTDGEIYDIEYSNWIPVSERLPRQNEYVGNVCKYYLVQNEFGDMLVATYTNNGWIPINTMQALEYDVVAWCPLPKSYKAGEKE